MLTFDDIFFAICQRQKGFHSVNYNPYYNVYGSAVCLVYKSFASKYLLVPPAGLTGKPRSLLDPLPILGKVSSAPTLHKALPPLDLKGVNSMAPKVTLEPVPKLDIKTDAKSDENKNNESDDESFSDDSELLPALNVKMSPNKKLFGLIDSDEENPPNKNGAKTPADSEKIGAKTFLEKEISPRSISQGDVSNNEEDDSW